MEQEFTKSIYWKIFYGVSAAGFAAFALILYVNDHSKMGTSYLLLPLILFLLALLIIANQIKAKVIISAEKITRITVFGRKDLLCNNVKGIRIGQKTIYIEPLETSAPTIIINNYNDYDNNEELIKWLKENFKDLDTIDLVHERDKLLQDTSLGTTAEEREAKLKKAKGIANTYNIVGGVLALAGIPVKSNLAVYIVLLYPLAGIIIMITSSGLTKFVSSSKRSVYTFVMLGFTFPIFMMVFKSLFDYEIAQYTHLWPPFLIIGFVLFFLLYISGINNAIPVNSQIVLMVVVSLFYGYSATIQINCVFDNSVPKVVHTVVVSKRVEFSRRLHYHLRLTSWDADRALKDIEVSKSTFDRYINGANIDVDLKQGFFNIPWYYLA